jgi:hypothetical protein
VATVEHVVDNAQTITLKRNGVVVAHGTVIGSDAARDIALVRTDKPVTGYRFRLTARTPQLGEDVSALGFPLGLPLTLTRGSVSGSGRTITIDGVDRHELVQTDTAVNPGNSGGPLITDAGAVIGLVDAKSNAGSGIGFAVSAAVAAPLIQAWQAAPQPVPTTACTSPTQTQAAPTSTQVPTYTAADFSIEYPAGWAVSHIPESGGNVDSTFEPQGQSGYMLRVDENSSPPVATAAESAAPVIAHLRRDPTYTEIGVSNETFDGVPAVRWEFEVIEGGQRVHKVDEFFIDSSGHGWGVLFQTPQSRWLQDGATLQGYVESFASG